MKYLAAVLAVFMMAGGAFAADATPALKINKVTGTVNLMKDGLVVMTLKPGSAIPQIVDPSMTFVVVDGSIEVESAGQKVTGNAGSNFTVTSGTNKVNVVTAAGTTVEIKTATGDSFVVAPASQVKVSISDTELGFSVQKGSAVMASSSGGQGRTIKAGDYPTVSFLPAVVALLKRDTTADPVVTINTVQPDPVLPTITSSVNPTQEVVESNEVSPSTPR